MENVLEVTPFVKHGAQDEGQECLVNFLHDLVIVRVLRP